MTFKLVRRAAPKIDGYYEGTITWHDELVCYVGAHPFCVCGILELKNFHSYFEHPYKVDEFFEFINCIDYNCFVKGEARADAKWYPKAAMFALIEGQTEGGMLEKLVAHKKVKPLFDFENTMFKGNLVKFYMYDGRE